MTRGKGPYPYPCPKCGRIVLARQAWAARHRGPCRPCVRVANGWTCRACGSSDPEHPFPCPEAVEGSSSDPGAARAGHSPG